jgi:hypothetical protein
MKIELLVSRTDGNRGDIVEVSDAEAKRMIEAGQGVPVRSVAKVETTVAQKRGLEKASK